jgi:hypothetical protein
MAAGADAAEIVAGPPDGLSFGERLAAAIGTGPLGEVAPLGGTGPLGEVTPLGGDAPLGGLVVLGSGSIPLARAADLRLFVEAAAGPGGHALANNRYSADVVAISRADDLAGLPPLPADNALPRWLDERAGVAVSDLRRRWRLGVDIDTPLDLIALGLDADLHSAAPLIGERLGERLAALADVLTNRRAELLVAGRVSAATLRWLESGVACRVRALIEERGMRASSRLAQSAAAGGGTAGRATADATADATANRRPPRSILGALLDRDGPESLAATVAGMADAAVIDTRVLLAHRHGADESATAAPSAEDRFASDLLLPAAIADPWLRSLTESAIDSQVPILLGGHTMVNGGLRLLAQRARAGKR